MAKQRRRSAQEWFATTVALLYQWAATIFMWAAIASNYSHIRWYILRYAAKKDWTATAMAFVIEAGIGLSIHQFITSLRWALLSIGRSGTTKQDRRFNRWLLPIFGLFAMSLAAFSATCNTAFFGGDKTLGWIAPSLTIAFAILEASKELLATKRGQAVKKEDTEPKPVKPKGQAVPVFATPADRVTWLIEQAQRKGVNLSDSKVRLSDFVDTASVMMSWKVISARTMERYLSKARDRVATGGD